MDFRSFESRYSGSVGLTRLTDDRYFAELVKEVIQDLEDSKYQKAEFRGTQA